VQALPNRDAAPRVKEAKRKGGREKTDGKNRGAVKFLEWKTNAEYAVVVVQMEMCRGDLKSAAESEADSLG
jgi:outer membrane biogenesis lipoprotein LolB